MKKLLSILLMIAMILSMTALASCGSKDKSNSSEKSNTTGSDTTTSSDAGSDTTTLAVADSTATTGSDTTTSSDAGSDTTTLAVADSTAEASETETTAAESTEKKTLVMATNATFPPYEYYDGDKMVGIDVEIATALAEKLNMTLEIKDVPFDSIIAGIESGSFTIGMAGMTVTSERLETVNFSTSYAKGVQVVIVKEGSDIASVDDLSGKKIGVQQGTTGDIYACEDYGEENVSKFRNGPDAVQGLISDKVDAVIIDNEPAKNYVAANSGLKILDTTYVDEDYAIALAKKDIDLLNNINAALNELKDDGTIAAIIEKYIPTK